VNEVPRQWGASTNEDPTKNWFEQAQKPLQFVPKLADAGPTYVTEQPTEFFAETDESVVGDTLESTIEMLSKTRPYSDLAGILDEESSVGGLATEEPSESVLPSAWRGFAEAPGVEPAPAPAFDTAPVFGVPPAASPAPLPEPAPAFGASDFGAPGFGAPAFSAPALGAPDAAAAPAAAAPVPAPAPTPAPVGLTRRQLREMVGPLTTPSNRD
jgi:hypothetical protein